MGTLISIIKIITFLFPFIKEIVISENKDPTDRRRKNNTRVSVGKKITIVIICSSLVLNYYLIVKVFDLGRKNLALQNQIKDKDNKPVEYTGKNREVIIDKDQSPMGPASKPSTTPINPKPKTTPNKENDKKQNDKRHREVLLEDLEQINKIH